MTAVQERPTMAIHGWQSLGQSWLAIYCYNLWPIIRWLYCINAWTVFWLTKGTTAFPKKWLHVTVSIHFTSSRKYYLHLLELTCSIEAWRTQVTKPLLAQEIYIRLVFRSSAHIYLYIYIYIERATQYNVRKLGKYRLRDLSSPLISVFDLITWKEFSIISKSDNLILIT